MANAMSDNRGFFGFTIALALATVPSHAVADCKLEAYAELPVTMSGTTPLIAGAINGVGGLFIADSGAFFSMLTRESAARLKLRLEALPARFMVWGIGGAVDARLATVKDFTLAGLGSRVFHNVQFVVVGNSFATEAAGLIGQNVIGHADTEYDLANGFIRLFHTMDCGDRPLAYWSGTAGFAVVSIAYTTELSSHLIGTAKLNGTKIRVLFDTGAARSMLNLKAAARAGIRRDGAEVVAGGLWSGVGRQSVETWLARFDRLDLGGEEVKNARLRIGDIELPSGADMVLGADFFLSHRIFVAASRHKIYFTYNGGHVFDLSVSNSTKEADASATDEPAVAPTSAEPQQPPTEAAGFRRRGAASAGRGDFLSAIADLNQAINLDPADPANYYQRAIARWQDHQLVLAMGDFDQALKLRPDDIPALMGRGMLRLVNNDESGAAVDFDAITSLAPNDASLGLRMAQSYGNTGHFDDAINRFDRWIAAYPKDERIATALDGRCWARAVINKGLDLALADCNAALRSGPRSSQVLGSRAMVWLRLGELDKSIVDYKASLSLQSKSARSLYGLGVAELKKGMKEQGDKDIQAAVALNRSVADEFKRMGLGP
jgi:tetratricopeptide (TPR) repeat protein